MRRARVHLLEVEVLRNLVLSQAQLLHRLIVASWLAACQNAEFLSAVYFFKHFYLFFSGNYACGLCVSSVIGMVKQLWLYDN
jgi:hypothetical protein